MSKIVFVQDARGWRQGTRRGDLVRLAYEREPREVAGLTLAPPLPRKLAVGADVLVQRMFASFAEVATVEHVAGRDVTVRFEYGDHAVVDREQLAVAP